MSRCKKNIIAAAMGFHTNQCSRDAVKDGYCWQHHPCAEQKRRDASDRRYAEKQKNDPYAQYFRMRDQLLMYIGKLARKKTVIVGIDDVINALNAIVSGKTEGTS